MKKEISKKLFLLVFLFSLTDGALKRCQPGASDCDEDLKLDSGTLKLLEKEMRRLFHEGYRWDNEYTQCSIRQILFLKQNNQYYDPGLCSRLLSMSKPLMVSKESLLN